MSDKQIFRLVNHHARQAAMRAITYAQDGMIVEVKPATRSLDQNAKLHAFFGYVAKHGKHHDRTMTPDQWKVLFISGHAIATGRGAEMIPGLENEFVNIRESSAHMSVARMSSLIDYIGAWCATTGFDYREPAALGYTEMQHA